jgi:hypothetical protein
MQRNFASVVCEAFEELRYTIIVTYFHRSSISTSNVVSLQSDFCGRIGDKIHICDHGSELQLYF